ncbi:hypothetical protein, partial [Kitasatospora sp. NPDC094015]|uniref:hypothetical protein n=1 Tax=Kitasatospora sp. NPDC094015 TaxID=3155205 RepID=UPI003317EBD7
PTTASTRLRTRYGAHPLHLLLMAGCFALAAYAAIRLLTGRSLEVALWIIGGALLHDLVLVPLYSGADLTTQAALTPRANRTSTRTSRNALVNHVRVPAFLALLLLLVWFPLVLDLSRPYPGATALSETVYLTRWLLITAALFAASAVLFAARLLLRRATPHTPPRPRHGPAGARARADAEPPRDRAPAAPAVPPTPTAVPRARGASPHPALAAFAGGGARRKVAAVAAAVVLAAAVIAVRRARRAAHHPTHRPPTDPQGPRP